MSTAINEKCSLYKPFFSKKHGVWVTGTKPITVDIIKCLTKCYQPELLTAIRNEPEKDKRSKLKLQLWGITASSIQKGGRGEDYVIERNGLLAFDIDKAVHRSTKGGIEVITEEPIQQHEVQQILDWVKKIPYTLYAGRSASGLGVWGLFRVSNPEKHDQHFDAMAQAFSEAGLKIDPAPRNIASMRFLSFDADAYFNADAKVFDKILEPVRAERKPLTSRNNNADGETNDVKALTEHFNATCTRQEMFDILENFKFTFHSTKGTRYRFTRPGKSTKAGLSVDYDEKRRTLYCFSSEVPLLEHWKAESAGGWSCSPVTALLLYGFGGKQKKHWAQAINYLKNR